MSTPWTGRTDELMDRFSGSQHEDVRREMASTMDSPQRVLNVGCGPNYLKRHLDCECVGLDFEAEWPDADIIADARNIPFPKIASTTARPKRSFNTFRTGGRP